MHIDSVDVAATLGDTPLHHVSPKTKLTAFALVLAAVIVNQNVLVVAAIALALLALAIGTRQPLRRLLPLAVYPTLFAAIFAFASAPDILTAALFVLRAFSAALAAVMVAFTTPYPQIFAPLQAITPTIVGDAMLMTYRSMFLLLGKLSNLLRAAKLRAGLAGRSPLRSAKATTQALGGLLLYSFDLAQRDYDVMRLRGYERRLRAKLPRSADIRVDIALLAGAAALLVASVAFRVAWRSLNPLSWLAPVAGLALVAIAAGFSARAAVSRPEGIR